MQHNLQVRHCRSACLALALLATWLCWSPGNCHAQPTRRPNILLILSDDQGWGDLSINGNKNLKTPHIDSLAHRGATLDHFYVQPVCAPTRAELLTGRYYPRTGVRGVSQGQERINLNETFLSQLLRLIGYITGAFGKWHNGSQWPYHPNARGFEEFYGFTHGHWGQYFDSPMELNGKPARGKGYIADDLTDKALAFMTKNKDQPFFCYVPYNTPHSPFCVPDEYWNRFKDNPIAQREKTGKNENLAVTRCILAMCENLDWNVGRLLSKLDELKLADDTIVIFCSDNGPIGGRWNGGMKGRKDSTDEGGVRSPCFIRWTGKIPAGRVVPQIAGAIDLLPTLLELVKAPKANGLPLDGKDLSPLLFRDKVDWPERMIFATWQGKVSVRTQQYRLDASGALFDMAADPGQTKDIAKEPSEVAKRLRQAVADWRKEVLPEGKGKDTRPFPVGYVEFPMTPLPARDGVPHGGVRRSASAPNSSYFINWKTKDDSMTWDIDVNRAGKYRVEIQYACPEKDLGATIELRFKEAKTTGKATTGWYPPLLNNQDRVPRKGESYMREFQTMTLPPLTLAAGRGQLTLRAVDIPGMQVMEVLALTLTLE
jgi:arylsulfatase A-like enzyme